MLQIVRNTVRDIGLSHKVAEAVFNTTRGNPYFVLETLRSLAEQGVIQGDSVDQNKLRGVMLPTSMKALMRQRLERLDPERVDILSASSVMGTDFDHELLLSVTGMPKDKMLRHLETALKAGLLQERRGDTAYRLGFADPRIRSLLQEDLSTIRKRRIHDRIGNAWKKSILTI